MTPTEQRESLHDAARSFCSAFAEKAPYEVIASHFSPSSKKIAFEHGLPQLAPFLGRTFEGDQGIRKYFELLSAHLQYEHMWFDNYIIDSEVRKVSVRGHAKFSDLATGQTWDEVFAYQLGFDEDNKVLSYEIWSDTGAAYLAGNGHLRN